MRLLAKLQVDYENKEVFVDQKIPEILTEI